MTWRTIAHRGAPQKYRENTLPSFVQAISAGAQYIELDVHTTRDGVLIVHHDPIVENVGVKCHIDRASGEEIAQLNLPFVIPTLNEILHLCALHDTTCYVEVKTKDPRAVDLVFEATTTTNASIILSSFHHPHLERSKHLNANIPTMALLDWEQSVPRTLIHNGWVNEIGVGDNLLANLKQKEAHALGVPTFVYTVNAQKDMDKFQQLGFAGVFTDTF